MKTRVLTFVLCAMAAFLIAGCSTPEIVQPTSQSQAKLNPEAVRIGKAAHVLVLAPRLTCEKIADETPLAADPGLAKQLMETAVTKLTAKGVAEVRTLALPWELTNQLQRVFSKRTDEKLLHYLGNLGATNSCVAVFVQSALIKRGFGDIPFSINSDNSSTRSTAHFQAALLEAPSGRILWQNAILVRWWNGIFLENILRPPGISAGDKTMKATLDQLYSTLIIQH